MPALSNRLIIICICLRWKQLRLKKNFPSYDSDFCAIRLLLYCIIYNSDVGIAFNDTLVSPLFVWVVLSIHLVGRDLVFSEEFPS